MKYRRSIKVFYELFSFPQTLHNSNVSHISSRKYNTTKINNITNSQVGNIFSFQRCSQMNLSWQITPSVSRTNANKGKTKTDTD
jgi:hypothetical protein